MTSKLPCADHPTLCGECIVFVLGSFKLGGAERQALLLAQYFKEVENATVEIWGFCGPGRVSEFCEKYEITWRVVPLSWGKGHFRRFMDLLQFAWTLRKKRPSLIFPYTMLPNVVCGLVWRWSGARLCVWNQRDEGVQRVGYIAERWAARQVPIFIANSRGGAQFLAKELGVNPELIKIIRNGIVLTKPELDRTNWRAKLGLAEDTFAVCMVGNLHGNKDHATLLQAWRLVLEKMDKIERSSVLLLAGRKDDSKSLEMLCRSLNIESKVKFLGIVNDMAGLLQAVDLGVLSSRSEGCPNGVLECMAAGLAVAGTDIQGIRDVIGPEGHAFLAPPGNAAALAEYIVTLALDTELRNKLGTANHIYVNNEFNTQQMCEKTVTLIKELMTNDVS